MLPMIMSKSTVFLNCTVQSYWNLLENVLLTSADTIAPLKSKAASKSVNGHNNFIPPSIGAKINKRKRLLKIDRLRKSNTHCDEIKKLSIDIFFSFLTCIAGLHPPSKIPVLNVQLFDFRNCTHDVIQVEQTNTTC